MKVRQRAKMAPGLAHCITLIVLLTCCARTINAFNLLQLINLSGSKDTNSSSKLAELNSSLVASEIGISNKSIIMNKNSSFQNSHSSTNQSSLNNDGLQKPSKEKTETHDFSASRTTRKNFLDDYEEASNLTSLSNLTAFGNVDNNETHYIIWTHFINFTNFVIYHKYIGEDDQQKDSRLRKYLAAHKLLALFLGMAGVLACLLIIVYCVYIRQHKEDMFSHHRLYGEGFEDPVLHLDTPVDHLDFFSFRDTETTPCPTPQHKCQKTPESKGQYVDDAQKTTLSDDQLHQAIQMGTIKFS